MNFSCAVPQEILTGFIDWNVMNGGNVDSCKPSSSKHFKHNDHKDSQSNQEGVVKWSIFNRIETVMNDLTWVMSHEI